MNRVEEGQAAGQEGPLLLKLSEVMFVEFLSLLLFSHSLKEKCCVYSCRVGQSKFLFENCTLPFNPTQGTFTESIRPSETLFLSLFPRSSCFFVC